MEQWRKEEIRRLLANHRISEGDEAVELLYEHAEVAMKLHLDGEEDYRAIGNSRIAGRPDLPPSIQWPCTEDGEYYTFLAQVNVQEMPFAIGDEWPNQGIFYFFLGADEPAYNVDHVVYYYDGDPASLRLADPPEEMEEVYGEDREFDAYRVKLLPHLSLPDLGEDGDVLLDQHERLYSEVCDQSDALAGGLQSWNGNTALDAYLCLNGMEELIFSTHKTEQQLLKKASDARSNGQETYGDRLEHIVLPLLKSYKEHEEEHIKEAAKWRLLFSISSLNEVGMCWWDAGFLEFLIHKDDLIQRRFDRTYCNLATS
ncbi:DUF1963 domain-containing protein [Paenibacillus sp. CAU 1782]